MNPALDYLVHELRQLVGAEAPVAVGLTPVAGLAPVVAGLAEAGAGMPRPSPTSPGSATPATTTPPAATPVPAPPPPVQTVDFAQKGYHLDAKVAPDQVVAAAKIMDRVGFCLDTITGVDWLAQGEMEVVYDYLHFASPLRVVVRTRLPRATPELPTILGVFPSANWHERETHDFFGIRFAGHPNLKPFLLPEDADFHPLRKDYQP